MTYEQIVKANELIKTTDVKGKEYAEVNQRIKAFRSLLPNGSIETEIISVENGVVIMKAVVRNEEGNVIGIGHAYEKENSTFINKTSYIENCETSAVGRALGMCGFGIETSIASYEEVANAIKNQEEPKPTKARTVKKQSEGSADYRTMLISKIKELNIDINTFAKQHNLNGNSTQEDYKVAYELLINQERELGFYE